MKNVTRFIAAFVLISAGCQKAYYGAYYKFWESLGKEKRDLLISEIKKANEDQAELKEQFSDTLQKVRVEYGFKEGKVGDAYNALSSDYERAEAKYEKLHDRIIVVRTIAHDLFKEWASEAREIEDKALRDSSVNQLEKSKTHFNETDARMTEVEKRVKPVLKTLRSHVLYLKHELNAKAVGSLESNLKSVEPEIQNLIHSLEESITYAKAFEQNVSQSGLP